MAGDREFVAPEVHGAVPRWRLLYSPPVVIGAIKDFADAVRCDVTVVGLELEWTAGAT
jgi:hypothetical protein